MGKEPLSARAEVNQVSPLRMKRTTADKKLINIIIISHKMMRFICFSLGIGILLSLQAQVKMQVSQSSTIKDTPQVIVTN